MSSIKSYAKFIVQAITATVAGVIPALADGRLDTVELVNGGILAVGAVAVYVVPNLPTGPAKYGKFGVSFLTAAGVALASALSGGVNTAEWLQIGLAAFGAVGLYIIPNQQTATPAA